VADFNLTDRIISNEYFYCGALGDHGSLDPEMIDISVADVMGKIPAELVGEALRQALTVAIPAVIRAHQEELDDGNCNGCGPERNEGCQHECKPGPDGICYEWCPPCSAVIEADAEACRAHNAKVQAARLDRELPKSVLSTAVNIGLGESRRTLTALRSGADHRPQDARLLGAWESAVEHLQTLAGPPVEDRRRQLKVGDRVTVLPVEPCGLCGDVLSVRTATVTMLPDDENRYEVALDDPYGIHISGDGNGRCSGRVGLVRYRADELALLGTSPEASHG